MNERLVAVRLYGHLRARFGREYRLAVKTPGEAVRALCAVVKGFEAHVRRHSEPGYRVLVDRTQIGADELHHPSGIAAIKIVPVVAGAGGGGKILGGIALIGLSFVPGLNVAVWAGASATFSSIAFNLGISMVLGGVSQMLAGSPKAPTPAERPDNQPSYAFNGAVNVTAQGNAVPILIGRMRVGSVVISSGLSTAQLPA
jgi:predicted phage tail protein